MCRCVAHTTPSPCDSAECVVTMELLGFVLAPVVSGARRRLRVYTDVESDAKGLLAAMQVVAASLARQSDHIQDAVERIQKKEFKAAKSWMEQGLSALGAEAFERASDCFAKVETEAQVARHALPCKTPDQCRHLIECYSLLIIAGFYTASKGGAELAAGVAAVDAYYKEITNDLRLRRMLTKALTSTLYLSEDEEKLLIDAVRLEWHLSERMSLKWCVEDPDKDTDHKYRLKASSGVLGINGIGTQARKVLRRRILHLPPTRLDLPPYVTAISTSACDSPVLYTGFADRLMMHEIAVGIDGKATMEEKATEHDISCASIRVSSTGCVAVLTTDGCSYVYDKNLELQGSIEYHAEHLTWAHSMVLTSDGNMVYCWNDEGEFQHEIDLPAPVQTLAGSASGHACVVYGNDCDDAVSATTWNTHETCNTRYAFHLGRDPSAFARSDSSPGGSEDSGTYTAERSVQCTILDTEAFVLLAPSRCVHLASHCGGVIEMPKPVASICATAQYIVTACLDESIVYVWEPIVSAKGFEASLLHVLNGGGPNSQVMGIGLTPEIPPLVVAFPPMWGGVSTQTDFIIDEESLLTPVVAFSLSSAAVSDKPKALKPTLSPSDGSLRSPLSPNATTSPISPASSPSTSPKERSALRERASTLLNLRKPSIENMRKARAGSCFMEIPPQ